MAKFMGYYENFRDEAHRAEVGSEGPFVAVRLGLTGDRYRIEKQESSRASCARLAIFN